MWIDLLYDYNIYSYTVDVILLFLVTAHKITTYEPLIFTDFFYEFYLFFHEISGVDF